MKKIIPRIIFSDFDGTLTDHNNLTEKFLEVIDLSFRNKIPFVIVTGRSVSWAHFFLTHFSSLDYVISEGGGVISYRDKEGLIVDEFQVDEEEIRYLEGFTDDLVDSYYGVSLTADSMGRKTDRAIDLSYFASEKLLAEVKYFMDNNEISYSTSNVHLNFWKGNLSKYNAVKVLLEKFLHGLSLDEGIFFGDGENDQSLFKEVFSVGVSNIKEILDKLEFPPQIILEGKENSEVNGVLNYLEKLLK